MPFPKKLFSTMKHTMLRRLSTSNSVIPLDWISCGHSSDKEEYSMPTSTSMPTLSSELKKSIRISCNYDGCINSSHEDCEGSLCSPSSRQRHKSYHEFHIRKQETVLILCYLVTVLAFSIIPGTAGIDCFKCVSLKGDNPSCEDPFHNNYSVSILESPCMGGRKGRNGLFPATACIKLAGKYYDTGETITVRGCALDSGTLNVDTEIIRMSHCGHFWFDERYVKGCLQSCDDADGCNGSSRPNHFSAIIPLLLISSITLPLYFLPDLAFCFYSGTRLL